LCQAYQQQYGARFISAIPANNFGPGDDFSPEDSHVIGALIHKMHKAKLDGVDTVEIWGTGMARREFIYVDDLADACLFLMHKYDSPDPINIGSGIDLSIKELAHLIKEIVGYQGELKFDPSRPDGMPLKAVDSSKLFELNWQPKTSFREALATTYAWFLQTQKERLVI
jgi:GDP-L-fucose synthase